MSYITRLLGRADDELGDALADAIAIQPAPEPDRRSTLERAVDSTQALTATMLNRRNKLEADIAAAQEELRQVNIVVDGMDAAMKVMSK